MEWLDYCTSVYGTEIQIYLEEYDSFPSRYLLRLLTLIYIITYLTK